MRTIINILAFAVLTFSCNKTDKKSISDLPNLDSLETRKIKSKKMVRGIIYENENVRIVGDTNIDKDKIFYVSMKFEPYISFEDFKALNFDTFTKAELNLSSYKNANNFRTVIREKYNDKKANFGGHYTFVEWGCGVPCRSSLLVDRQSGRIYSSPTASLGYDYRANSRMLIVNPPDSTGYYDDCSYCKPIIFEFDERTKKFIQIGRTKK